MRNLLEVMESGKSRKEIQEAEELEHEGNFRENYLELALVAEVIKMKYSDSHNYPKQRYLVTKNGGEIKIK
ncbi:Fic family protein [Flavobacterium adhaerens]|uniref:Fic family protein n=1 Tax=Flavobacterium adhaerens TaxID=3149043 RepID=UPI0032B4381B